MKDQGVLISYDLSWGAQTDAAVNKANKILGIVYRTVAPTNQEAFSILYINYVYDLPLNTQRECCVRT